MTLSDLCKRIKADEKDVVDLIYHHKDPLDIKTAIIQKYCVSLNGPEILELLETTPIRRLSVIPQEG